MPRDIPVGNGSLLVNFDHYYQVRDIYWPHVGMYNHTSGQICRFGVWVDGRFRWMDNGGWDRKIGYLEDTLVTEVRLSHEDLGIELVCNDLVDFHENIYLKKIRVRKKVESVNRVRLFFAYDFSLNGHDIGDTAYYEPQRQALFHYKERTWFMLCGGQEREGELYSGIDSWAVGDKKVHGLEGTYRDAEDGELSGNPVAQGSIDSVIAFHADFKQDEDLVIWHWFAAGVDFHEVTRLGRRIRRKGAEAHLKRSRDYWRLWVNKEEESFSGLPCEICDLGRRSLLILRSQIDNSGGIMAANDHDSTLFSRDTYSYVWPRDGALVAAALIEVGYSEISRRFFDFCHQTITEEGYLLHKYNADGSLASSWHGWYRQGEKSLPVQEDETALVLWALWQHFQQFRDIEYIKTHYRGLMVRAANWLAAYRDQDSGLPLPSWDLWEERYGVHAWTVGAVWAGLEAAARFAGAFGEDELALYYQQVAAGILEAAKKYMWDEDRQRYLRMIVRQQGVWQKDETVDASLVGLWYFGMLPADDPGIKATMETLEQKLTVKAESGGLARYENDYYYQVSEDLTKVPGNPWFITTLWLAQWHLATARRQKDLTFPRQSIQWAADRTLPSGVMAEQIHPHSNNSLSVSPLTWSHATMVATIRQYMAVESRLSS